MKLEKIFSGFNISALGLSAQRKRMNAIANNMANAETTHTEEGGPFKRKIVVLKANEQTTFSEALTGAGMGLATTNKGHFSGGGTQFGAEEVLPGGVESAEVEDTAPFKMVYDASHPDADENGYVRMPNVNVVTEMVDMISASRSYEANVAAIAATKTMMKDTLEI